MSGFVIMCIGIILFVISLILEFVFTIVFSINKKNTVKKIYESYDE